MYSYSIMTRAYNFTHRNYRLLVLTSPNSLYSNALSNRATEQTLPVNCRLQRAVILINEPHRDKTNKMACVPSKDSDQPGHPPSLIRVFSVRLKKAWVLSYPLSPQRMPIWVFAWRRVILLVLSQCGSNFLCFQLYLPSLKFYLS